MTDSDTMMTLRVALRESQDLGALPSEGEATRRFQVMVGELAVPVLRDLVNLFCMEGLTAYLIMGMDEAVPYIGIELANPNTTLWIYPSTTGPEVLSSVQGGLYPEYFSLRMLSYRILSQSTLETVLVEQLRLVLCPPQPIM